jgi:PTS system mannose-specific IIA component
MVGIVLVSHGEMAAGMLDAARMIVGEQEQVLPVSLKEEDDVEGLMGRIAEAIKEVDTGEGVLVLVDVFGASPFNASARLALEGAKIEVITGMNLPMLLEMAVQRGSATFEELVEIGFNAGASGIRKFSDTIKKE